MIINYKLLSINYFFYRSTISKTIWQDNFLDIKSDLHSFLNGIL